MGFGFAKSVLVLQTEMWTPASCLCSMKSTYFHEGSSSKVSQNTFCLQSQPLLETTFSSDMISILLHVAPTIPAHLLLAIVVDQSRNLWSKMVSWDISRTTMYLPARENNSLHVFPFVVHLSNSRGTMGHLGDRTCCLLLQAGKNAADQHVACQWTKSSNLPITNRL